MSEYLIDLSKKGSFESEKPVHIYQALERFCLSHLDLCEFNIRETIECKNHFGFYLIDGVLKIKFEKDLATFNLRLKLGFFEDLYINYKFFKLVGIIKKQGKNKDRITQLEKISILNDILNKNLLY